VATRVVASFNSPAGDHCVDIFLRDDGTFGFEEYRRDPEDMRGWFPLHRYSKQPARLIRPRCCYTALLMVIAASSPRRGSEVP
jgi:hypothetical protein